MWRGKASGERKEVEGRKEEGSERGRKSIYNLFSFHVPAIHVLLQHSLSLSLLDDCLWLKRKAAALSSWCCSKFELWITHVHVA